MTTTPTEGYETLRQTQQTAFQRAPVYLLQAFQDGPNSAPQVNTAGVAVSGLFFGGLVDGFVRVRLRKYAGRQQALVRVDSLTGSASDYGIHFGPAVGGFSVVASGSPATPEQMAAALKAALTAETQFTQDLGGVASQSGNLVSVLTSRPSLVRVGVGALFGSPNMSAICEASFARVRVWVLRSGRNDSATAGGTDLRQWSVVADALVLDDCEEIHFKAQGAERIYVQVVESDGYARLEAGAFVSESQGASLRDTNDQKTQTAEDAFFAFDTSSQGSRLASQISRQAVVSVGDTATVLAQASFDRLAIRLQNAGANDAALFWVGAGADSPAFANGKPFKAGQVFVEESSIARGMLIAVCDSGNTTNIHVEEV